MSIMNIFNKPDPLDFGTLQYQKKLFAKDFRQWPFDIDSVTVGVVDSDYCLIDILGAVYALNGLAVTKFNLTNVQNTIYYKRGSGNAGYSIQPIIDEALYLDPKNIPGERTVFNLEK